MTRTPHSGISVHALLSSQSTHSLHSPKSSRRKSSLKSPAAHPAATSAASPLFCDRSRESTFPIMDPLKKSVAPCTGRCVREIRKLELELEIYFLERRMFIHLNCCVTCSTTHDNMTTHVPRICTSAIGSVRCGLVSLMMVVPCVVGRCFLSFEGATYCTKIS